MGLKANGVRTAILCDGSIVDVPVIVPFDPMGERYTGIAQAVIRVYPDYRGEVMFVTVSLFKSYDRGFDQITGDYQRGLACYYAEHGTELDKKRSIMYLSKDLCEKFGKMGWSYLKTFGKGSGDLFFAVMQFQDGDPIREKLTLGTAPEFPDLSELARLVTSSNFISYPKEWDMGPGFLIPSN